MKLSLNLNLNLVLVLLAVSAPDVWGGERIQAVLSAQDVLTAPGRLVRLEARLARAGLLGQSSGLGGEQVAFAVAGRNVGTAMTGGDGRALLEYTPRMRGNLEITVKLAPSKRVESQEAKGTLFSWERRRPILLVELAALAEEPKSPSVPIPALPLDLGPRLAPTVMPDAPDELKRLTDYFYNVIYLSWSGHQALADEEAARVWLRQYHFPPGLTVRLTGGGPALNGKLDELKGDGWDNLKAGVGRTRAFAEVLAERRMPVIILPASEREEAGLPKKTAVVKSWKEVRKKLQG